MMDEVTQNAMIDALKAGQVVMLAGGCDDCLANMRLQVKGDRTEMIVDHDSTCPTDLEREG